jgi:hypothetical protein
MQGRRKISSSPQSAQHDAEAIGAPYDFAKRCGRFVDATAAHEHFMGMLN